MVSYPVGSQGNRYTDGNYDDCTSTVPITGGMDFVFEEVVIRLPSIMIWGTAVPLTPLAYRHQTILAVREMLKRKGHQYEFSARRANQQAVIQSRRWFQRSGREAKLGRRALQEISDQSRRSGLNQASAQRHSKGA